jgi:methyltransferase-like protein
MTNGIPMTPDEAYDSFQYENYPFAATHPDWMFTIGRLHGLNPAPVEHCRVLELGSGRGGNLVPLAAQFPGSNFVGVDLAESQVADGQRVAQELGLANIRFEAMDICEVPRSWGEFDYIICHGVYSWVPDHVRSRILEIAATQLSSQGLGFISYNTYPGWHARGMLRSMMKRVIRPGSPAEMAAAAREFLQMYLTRIPHDAPLRPWVQSELSLLIGLSDRYIYFEHLVEENTPFYFADFVADAQAHGLSYVADADPTTSVVEQIGAQHHEVLDTYGDDPIAAEQMVDYLTTRYFRRSLICRSDAAVQPPGLVQTGQDQDGHRPPMAERLRGSWLCVDASDDVVDLGEGVEVSMEEGDNIVITSSDIHGSAISWILAESRPSAVGFEDLVQIASDRLGLPADAQFIEQLASRAWRLFHRGKITIGFWPRPHLTEVPERPQTSALARYQAQQGEECVTTMSHERMLVDSLDRLLLEFADGTHTISDLHAQAIEALGRGDLSIELDDQPLTDMAVLHELIVNKLQRFAEQALLMMSPT